MDLAASKLTRKWSWSELAITYGFLMINFSKVLAVCCRLVGAVFAAGGRRARTAQSAQRSVAYSGRSLPLNDCNDQILTFPLTSLRQTPSGVFSDHNLAITVDNS